MSIYRAIFCTIATNLQIFSLRLPSCLPVSAPLIEVDKETDEQNFLLWRIEKGVAEGSSEIPKGVFVSL